MPDNILYRIETYQNYFGKISRIESVYVVAKNEEEAIIEAKALYDNDEIEILIPLAGIQSYGKVI